MRIVMKKSRAMSMYTLTSTLIVTKKNIHMDTHTAMMVSIPMITTTITSTAA